MIFGSICSGIEAASVAWLPLGFKCAFVSEIEPFACAVLKHHYPEARNYGDFTKIETSEPIDILIGGTPCQSFSIAGKRAGFDSPNGNLALEFLALARRLRPCWLVWENVPGVLSSNGTTDFGTFLGALGQCGYGFAYRILDAQYFGVPQRRRRVFVVGYFGDWRPAAAVLFERESLRGDSAPGRETRKEVARSLRGRANASHREDIDNYIPELAGCLQERDGKGVDSDTKPGHLIVAHSLRAEGFDASEDGTGRGIPLIASPITASLANGPCCNDTQTSNGPQNLIVLPFDTTQITSSENRNNPKAGDPCHPPASAAHPPAIAFTQNQCGDVLTGDVMPAMGTNQSATGRNTPNIFQPISIKHDKEPKIAEGRTGTLQGADGGSGVVSVLCENEINDLFGKQQFTAVRRLTMRECERLQGFPDDWTLVPYPKKLAADGPRYRAIGNSMAVPVIRWIGERIKLVQEALA